MPDILKNDSSATERPAWKTADPFVYSQIKDVRQKMRDTMTEAEKIVWIHIKSKKLGVKFRRQHDSSLSSFHSQNLPTKSRHYSRTVRGTTFAKPQLSYYLHSS